MWLLRGLSYDPGSRPDQGPVTLPSHQPPWLVIGTAIDQGGRSSVSVSTRWLKHLPMFLLQDTKPTSVQGVQPTNVVSVARIPCQADHVGRLTTLYACRFGVGYEKDRYRRAVSAPLPRARTVQGPW